MIDVDQKQIVSMWASGHVAIRGNEAAYRATKEAIDMESTDDIVPCSDLKSLTALYVH